MASIAKFKQHSVGRLFQHNNRTAGDGVQHSNEMIDDAKTMFNYHLKRGSPEELDKRAIWKKAGDTSDVKTGRLQLGRCIDKSRRNL